MSGTYSPLILSVNSWSEFIEFDDGGGVVRHTKRAGGHLLWFYNTVVTIQ